MRVVIAPDGFGEVLDAVAAADAIAAGWRLESPADALDLAPISDGGPGFIAALRSALGGSVTRVDVTGPLGATVTAELLIDGSDAWIESAQACGLHLVGRDERDPRRATSYGVGELIAAAAAHGATTAIVGLGGSGTNDGGAGAWAAFGAQPAGELRNGGAALAEVTEVTVPAVPGSMSLVIATDVDNPLVGIHGASAVYGPQKGADRGAVLDLDDALRRWAGLVEVAVGKPGLRDEPGAGAAGGLGFGLLALGARRVSGARTVLDAVHLAKRLDHADLVVTGEGRLDGQSVRGKLVSAVASAAQSAGIPCVVVAGDVAIGEREAAAWGIDAIYSVSDVAGSPQAAIAAGARGLQAAARLAARDWRL